MDITSNIYQDLRKYGVLIASETSTVRVRELKFESPIKIWENNSLYGQCSLGAFSYINRFGMFANVHIGRYCSIASYVRGVGDHDHRFSTHPIWSDLSGGMFPDDAMFVKMAEARRGEFLSDPVNLLDLGKNNINIGNDVWIGEGVIIRAGVTIGNGAIVGANSFVRDDVPAYSVVAGTPAKVKKLRFGNEQIEKLEKMKWWLYKPIDICHLVDKSDAAKSIDFMYDEIMSGKFKEFTPDSYLLEDQSGGFKLTKLN
jgi:acetyltransferase-like isoleucine patch superfamily enzyme